MAADVVALKPRSEAAPSRHWEFTLDRSTLALELVIRDDAGHVIETASWPPATTSFDLAAAWDERVYGEPPGIAS